MPFDAASQSGASRRSAIALTLAVHTALIAFLMLPPPRDARSAQTALKLFDVRPDQPAEKSKPRKIEQVLPVPPQPVDLVVVPPPVVPLPRPSDIVVAMLEQSEPAEPGTGCDLTAPVQAALEESAEVQARLAHMPRAHRSVANAIMVWDTEWVTSNDKSDAQALEALRDTIAGTVAVASPACRLQVQAGPRLIILHAEPDNLVLALGSGTWRWQDVLQAARPGWSDEQLLADTKSKLTLARADDASLRPDERILSKTPTNP